MDYEKPYSKRLYRITKISQQATDELAYVVEENVLAHRMVRLHGAQAAQNQRFWNLSRQLRSLNIKSTIASSAMTPPPAAGRHGLVGGHLHCPGQGRQAGSAGSRCRWAVLWLLSAPC